MTRHDYERAIDNYLPDVLSKLSLRLQTMSPALMKKLMLERWDEGAKRHGPLDLRADSRDWMEEETAELVDAAAYRVFATEKRLSSSAAPQAPRSYEPPSPSLET
jgi:hypothetical protein